LSIEPRILRNSKDSVFISILTLPILALTLFAFLLSMPASMASTSYLLSDHFDGKYFHNIDRNAHVHRSIWDLLKWKLTNDNVSWPEFIPNTNTPVLPSIIGPDEIYMTFINHATELIQFKSLNVLTDPVFSERVSPLTWIGPKRVRPPGVSVNKLPHIDVVLISHNHHDHLDLASLKRLDTMFHPKFIVPLGNAELLRKENISNVIELDWWKTISYKDASITLTPASTRGPFTTFRSLWGGYIIHAWTLYVYFAGDTGYSSHFNEIRHRYGPWMLVFYP
jgi:hypothetical protein